MLKDVRLISKSKKSKIIPKILFDYIPKSSTFDTILVQVNDYEIVVKKFHISHNLTRYSAIVHKFTRIYPVWSTYEVTDKTIHGNMKTWPNICGLLKIFELYCARIQMQTLKSNVIITLFSGFSKPIMWPSISWLSSTVEIRTWIHFQRKHAMEIFNLKWWANITLSFLFAWKQR